jgi:hypothetical protein
MAIEVAKLRLEVDALLEANPGVNPTRAIMKRQNQSVTIYHPSFAAMSRVVAKEVAL